MTEAAQSTMELRNGDYSVFDWPKIRKKIIVMTIILPLMIFGLYKFIEWGIADETNTEQIKIDAINARIDEFNALTLEERKIVAKFEHLEVDGEFMQARLPNAEPPEIDWWWYYLDYRMLVVIYSLIIIVDYTTACKSKHFLCDLPRDHRTAIFVITTLGLWPIWVISYINMQWFLKQNPAAHTQQNVIS